MTLYQISFEEGAMTFPIEEMSDVGVAAYAVVEEANTQALGSSEAG